MTGNLAEHIPDPQPLIARYYEALGFSTPGTEYDPETGTYKAEVPWLPTRPGDAALMAELDTPDPDGCSADPQDCARWLSELADAVPDWEAS